MKSLQPQNNGNKAKTVKRIGMTIKITMNVFVSLLNSSGELIFISSEKKESNPNVIFARSGPSFITRIKKL